MTGITLKDATSFPAEFRVLQGGDQVARLGVAATGQAVVPTGNSYRIQARTDLGKFTLYSNVITFEADAAHFLAQVQMDEPGLYDFQIVPRAATQQSTILLENTWRHPVVFDIWKDNSPFAAVKVVDEHNTDSVSTAEQWTIFAIVNGITTTSVEVNNPDAVVTASADNNDDGFSLVVT